MLDVFGNWSSAIAAVLIATVGWYTRAARLAVASVDRKHESLYNDLTKQHDKLKEETNRLHVLIVGEYLKKEELFRIQADFKADMKEYLDGFKRDVQTSIARLEARVK